MNILPKTKEEFSSKLYWDKFFKEYKDSFEWYGDYDDIKSILLPLIKPEDKLLIIGCGNSTLSVDLYDNGFYNNVNIDISKVAINQMITKYKTNGIRDKLIFESMDMLEMKYPDESFNVVIDKGTLDAVSSGDFDIDKMFTEISRVLKYFGRYICVTLLQEHVLALFNWFSNANNWMVRFYRCPRKKDTFTNKSDKVNFPVFIVCCIKLKTKIANSFIEFKVDPDSYPQKYNNIDDVTDTIKSMQNIEFIKYNVRNNKILDENFFIELFDDNNSTDSRYMMYFVHAKNITSKSSKCSVMIVPQGREHEWMFSTVKGRRELLNQSRMDHLIVIILSRKHKYESLRHIINEIENLVTDFFPVNPKQIEFVSIDDGIGNRNIIWEGKSDFSGKMFVEDVIINNKNTVRRLVFSDTRNIIQSEARLKRDKNKYSIDNHYLACIHHQFIAAGLAIINKPFKETYSLLMIGLGGGCFINFLANKLNDNINLNVTIVEIDPIMEQIARDYFDFNKEAKENFTINVIIDDGLKFIENCAKTNKRFDFIIFDVDSKNTNVGISCPPEQFIEDNLLQKVKTIVTVDGLFILNLVARDEDIKKDVYNKLKSLYEYCLAVKMVDDLNEIILVTDVLKLDWFELKDRNRRYDYISKSCFFYKMLVHTYRDLCRRIRRC